MELSIASRMASDQGTVAAREVGMMDNVNVNHLFYGLIELAREQITPANGDVREPILQLKSYFEGEGIDLDATSAKLKPNLGNTDAGPRQAVLDKAILVAGVLGEKEVQPTVIASVILDDPTQTIGDSLVKGGMPNAGVAAGGAAAGIGSTVVDRIDAASDSIPAPIIVPEPVEAPNDPIIKPEPDPVPDQGPVRKPHSTPPVTPISDEDELLIDLIGGNMGGNGPAGGSSGKPSWLKTGGYVVIEVDQQQPPVQAPAPAKKEGVGARIVKTILYLAFAVIAPYLALMALDMTAGLESLVAGTPATDMALVMVVLVWMALILNTVSVAIKNVSPPGKAFVQFLIGMGFIWAATSSAIAIVPYDPVPVWLKIVTVLAYLVVIGLSSARIKRASMRAGNVYSTHAAFIKMKGTLQGMFFSYTAKSFTVPVIGLFVVSLFTSELPFWLQVIFALYAFFWIYSVLDMGFQCNAMRVQESPKRTRGKMKFAKMLLFELRTLALPLLGLFLMAVFGWWPMPIWLIVIYVIYGLIWLVLTFAAAKTDANDL